MATDQRLLAKQQIQKYCAYQERAKSQVHHKLKDYGLEEGEINVLVEELIDEGFLNEARFASAYCMDKLRLQKWGRVKIRYALQGLHVEEQLIDKSLNALPAEAYQEILKHLATTKSASLNGEENPWKRQQKLYAYLQSKGFTIDEIKWAASQVE